MFIFENEFIPLSERTVEKIGSIVGRDKSDGCICRKCFDSPIENTFKLAKPLYGDKKDSYPVNNSRRKRIHSTTNVLFRRIKQLLLVCHVKKKIK